MAQTYKYITDEMAKEMVNLRQEFHKFPEVGFCEYRTSGRIADILTQYGYQVTVGTGVCATEARMGVPAQEVLKQCEERAVQEGLSQHYLELMEGGHTGVVGVIQGGHPGKIVALRYDIDALPMTEGTGVSYQSVHDNITHACGHDGHIGVGLAVAKCIAHNRDKLHGEVRIIFQPAEEGCRGSRAIVANGWLDNVALLLSGHVGFQCKRLGQIYACTSGFMSTTKMDITFRGTSAHAAKNPERGANALLAAAVFTTNAYAISRTSAGDTRINIGTFHAGSGRNIIAERAFLQVETRGSDTLANQYMENQVKRIAHGVAEMYGVTCDIKLEGSSESATSSPQLTQGLKHIAMDMGDDIDYREDANLGASEDVVAMMNHVQSQGGQAAYYLFGTPLSAEHHQSLFDFDEAVLPLMADFYVRAILDYQP